MLATLRLVATSLLLVVSSAYAGGCGASDRWGGEDKRLHFAAGAAIATALAVHTGDPMTGFWVGSAAGVVKEALDATGMGQCSAKDLAVTVAGAAVGAWTGSLILTRMHGHTVVAYTRSF